MVSASAPSEGGGDAPSASSIMTDARVTASSECIDKSSDSATVDPDSSSVPMVIDAVPTVPSEESGASGIVRSLPDLDEAVQGRVEEIRKRVLADLSAGTATSTSSTSSSSSGNNDGPSFRKSKRNKLLLPKGNHSFCCVQFHANISYYILFIFSERKAYFAILSLLVDRGMVPAASKGQPFADAEAAEACVPESYRPVLNLLKE